MADKLSTIPLIHLVDGGSVELFESRQASASALLASASSSVPSLMLGPLDSLSRQWFQRAWAPYAGDIGSIAKVMSVGIWFANTSMEWGCTAGVAADPGNSGSRILRTLDWLVRGLGREVVVVRMGGRSVIFYNVTWSGYVGALTMMATGQFSAAVNQTPTVRRRMVPLTLNWGINRIKLLRSRAIPPTHLLRLVCETCDDYEQTKEVLCETPIALPALFTLSRMNATESCVIERLERRSFVHETPNAIANHWLNNSLHGKAQGIDSHRLMNGLRRLAINGFDWLIDPVLNVDTRLAAAMNAAQEDLLVRGFEPDGPAPEIFDLSAVEGLIEQQA
jgi:hypothetical protein